MKMNSHKLTSTMLFLTCFSLHVVLGVSCGTGGGASQDFNSGGILDDSGNSNSGGQDGSGGNSGSAANEVGVDGQFDRSNNDIVAHGFRIVSPPQSMTSATFNHVIDFELTQSNPVFDDQSDLYHMPEWFIDEDL